MGNTLHGSAKVFPTEREQQKLEILRNAHGFPITLRETIQTLKEEDADSFLSILEERFVDLLYGTNGYGLDCTRDTHQEVETAIRCFPQVLCEQFWGTHPPIYAQLAYLKSVPFVPTLARLGIELNQFQTEERGGIFYFEWNVLRSLVNNDCREWYDENDEYQQRLIDKQYASVIQGLGELGIFQKQDVRKQDLVWELSRNKIFPGHRFRCMVDYDAEGFYNPKSSIYKTWLDQSNTTTRCVFRTIFETGFFHFPTQMGFIFHIDNPNANRNNTGYTPFGRACHEYGVENVTKIVGDVLVKWYQYEIDSDGKRSMKMMDALIHAATHPTAHLDGVYFLLRRDPGQCCQAFATAVA